uniref:Tudor domain-containing protein n=1 Tax=Strongyloides papillosus TaxID=174720 RepID=A0A0N5CIK1_STREA
VEGAWVTTIRVTSQSQRYYSDSTFTIFGYELVQLEYYCKDEENETPRSRLLFSGPKDEGPTATKLATKPTLRTLTFPTSPFSCMMGILRTETQDYMGWLVVRGDDTIVVLEIMDFELLVEDQPYGRLHSSKKLWRRRILELLRLPVNKIQGACC